MFRLLDLLGLLAPVAGAALAVFYRRRLGSAFPFALLASVFALIASGIAMVSDRVRWFGGNAEGIVDRMEVGAGLRNLFLIAAWVLLLVAIARSRGTVAPDAGVRR
ncbi:hypothetical protein [Nocardia sp. NPDC020380]|uniref:hypothetical protein n=1 Tax=Nocardia sp. NPDC020380 TaxID=3364309 RepID=UPI0037952949